MLFQIEPGGARTCHGGGIDKRSRRIGRAISTVRACGKDRHRCGYAYMTCAGQHAGSGECELLVTTATAMIDAERDGGFATGDQTHAFAA